MSQVTEDRFLAERLRAVMQEWGEAHHDCEHKEFVESELQWLREFTVELLDDIEHGFKEFTGVERRVRQCPRRNV